MQAQRFDIFFLFIDQHILSGKLAQEKPFLLRSMMQWKDKVRAYR